MIPLTCDVNEIVQQKAIIRSVYDEVVAKTKVKKLNFSVGTMIEIPRAAVLAYDVAQEGGFLLLRHQRPDADDLRLLARRYRLLPPPNTSNRAFWKPTRSRRWTSAAWACSLSTPSTKAATPKKT